MDRNKLSNINQKLVTTLQILDCFDTRKEKIAFRLECLKGMLTEVQPYGDFYPVSDVYSAVASKLNTNMFTVRGIFVKLCQAGLIKREYITIPVTTKLNVNIDAFCLTTGAMVLLGDE